MYDCDCFVDVREVIIYILRKEYYFSAVSRDLYCIYVYTYIFQYIDNLPSVVLEKIPKDDWKKDVSIRDFVNEVFFFMPYSSFETYAFLTPEQAKKYKIISLNLFETISFFYWNE
jgi:hypothetical protein